MFRKQQECGPFSSPALLSNYVIFVYCNKHKFILRSWNNFTVNTFLANYAFTLSKFVLGKPSIKHYKFSKKYSIHYSNYACLSTLLSHPFYASHQDKCSHFHMKWKMTSKGVEFSPHSTSASSDQEINWLWCAKVIT